MEDYTKLVHDLIEDHVTDAMNWDGNKTRLEVLKELSEDHGNVFGNIDGSRTCSTYEAQQFINKSGAIWDDDILDLFAGIGDDYFIETLKRGAETLDVVICEMIADTVIHELIEKEKEAGES